MTQSYPDTHHDVSSNTIFGFWIYLLTDCVMFATFFATYAVLQKSTFGGPTPRDLANLPFALAETLILLASSFTCGIAMLFAPRKKIAQVALWFFITFVLGAIFMGMQFFEMQRLLSLGITWQKSAFLSAYYTLIGTHGLHILAGLGLMILFIAQLLYRGFTAAVLRRLTCLRIYWQFVYLIWIFTFTIVYLIGSKI